MATHIPYPWITGLTPVQQKELERNFLSIEQQITAGSSIFNAIIDATATANSSTHVYPNLSALLAAETWTTSTMFLVGVRNTPGTIIVETANMVLPGSIALIGYGFAPGDARWQVNTGQPGLRQRWNMSGKRITATLTTPNSTVTVVGLDIFDTNTGVAGSPFADGPVYLDNCTFSSVDPVSGASKTMDGVTNSGILHAHQTLFNGYIQSTSWSGTMTLHDCHWLGTVDLILKGTVVWQGGIWNMLATDRAMSLGAAGAGSVDIHVSMGTASGSSGSGALTVTVLTSRCSLIMDGLNNEPVNLSISSAAGQVFCEGVWRNITCAGSGNNRVIRGYARTSGDHIDITGPATVDLHVAMTGINSVKFRGTNVQAVLDITDGGTLLDFINCDHSIIVANVIATGVGRKAYAFDAASVNNLLILGGSHQANFSVASTDVGTANRVITETTDSAAILSGSAAGGKLAGTYPNPTFAAFGPGVTTKGTATKSAVVTTAADGLVSALTETPITGSDGDFTAVGNLIATTAGKGLKVKEGANACQGVTTLVGGSSVVSTTAVGANTRILLTVQSLGTVATPVAVAVTARTAATSFTITSADGTDTSVVAWELIEPA